MPNLESEVISRFPETEAEPPMATRLSAKVTVGSVPLDKSKVQIMEESAAPVDQVLFPVSSVGSKSRVPAVLSMARPPTKAPKSPTSGTSSSAAQSQSSAPVFLSTSLAAQVEPSGISSPEQEKSSVMVKSPVKEEEAFTDWE